MRQFVNKSIRQCAQRKTILLCVLILGVFGLIHTGRTGVLVDTVCSFTPSWANSLQGLTQGADGNFYGISTELGGIFKITRSGYFSFVARFPWDEASPPNSGALVLGPDGAFYGTTYVGGANDRGSVFKMTAARNIAVLYSFNSVTDTNGNNLDGIAPMAGLTLGRDGSFYGTTSAGGSNGCGTIFRITSDGAFTSLYSFGVIVDTNGNVLDGVEPAASLVEGSDGEFYGTTEYGGSGSGSIFKVTSSGVLTPLYQVPPPPDDVYAAENGPPSALALGADGNFYGTTTYGGSNYVGSVFEITPTGDCTTLYSFRFESDGAYPLNGLIRGRDGIFYGTASQGGPGTNGTIFRIAPSGKFSRLSSFNGQNGSEPNWLIQGREGMFYGTTANGLIFRVSSGGTVTLLFQGAGELPEGGLIQGRDGNLYGETQTSVFSVNPYGGFRSLGRFPGSNPYIIESDGVVEGEDGYFYGTTPAGGSDFVGTVFKVSPAGQFKTLVEFNQTNGAFAEGTLVKNSGDDFYGITASGGRWSAGTVFRVTRFGQFATLAAFDGKKSGTPLSLARGPNGNYYGTALDGGDGNGTIFEMNQLNQISVIASLNGTDGTRPTGLWFDTRGKIVSTASSGGIGGNGTFFEVPEPGVISTVALFGGNYGYQPGPPMQASDGNFYGTTSLGGENELGRIFQLTPSGKLTALPGDGGSGKLLQGNDGALYGTTPWGGDFSAGSVFRVAPSQYRGIFFDTNNIGFENSGAFELTVGLSLNVAGMLTIEGRQYAFSGELDSNLLTSIVVRRPQMTSLTMSLQFSETNDDEFGVIGDGNWNAEVYGVKPGLFNAADPAPEMGRYAISFSNFRNGSLTVSPYGKIAISGKLPDHTAISQHTLVSTSGKWPLFASLYGGKGSLFGWMSFNNSAGSQINGSASWIKTGTHGFTNSVTLTGSLH
jgi:uncharacterized repeat protein (TIGR03803 family)